jgi:ribosomal-protein-alanine N-acetyltransferase
MKREEIYRIFANIPTIQTKRLTLRRLMVSDAFDMYEYSKNSEVTRYLTWDAHPDAAYTREYLQYLGTHYNVGDFFDWGVVLSSEDKMIGTCGFTRFDYNNNCGEVGYVINPAYRGREIAKEALEAVMEFGFETLKLHRIEAKFMEGNLASLRVMEKVGMTFEGYHKESMFIKGEYRTVGVSAILRDEYFSKINNK